MLTASRSKIAKFDLNCDFFLSLASENVNWMNQPMQCVSTLTRPKESSLHTLNAHRILLCACVCTLCANEKKWQRLISSLSLVHTLSFVAHEFTIFSLFRFRILNDQHNNNIAHTHSRAEQSTVQLSTISTIR